MDNYSARALVQKAVADAKPVRTVEPGGTYVRTLSGRGAYPDKVDKHHEAWELDE